MTGAAAFQLDSSRSSASAGGTSSAGANFFYRYHRADGRTVIVDSLSQVPASERARVERIELNPPSSSLGVEALTKRLDWPSFAAGFGLALVLATIVLSMSRGSRRWLAFLLLLALVVGGSGAYFGWLRRTTGQDTAVFASPSSLIDDAHRAVEKMKAHDKERDRVIEDIQREAK